MASFLAGIQGPRIPESTGVTSQKHGGIQKRGGGGICKRKQDTIRHRQWFFPYARVTMDIYGLQDWKFNFDRRKRTAGLCNFTDKVITISSYFFDAQSLTDIINILLHEIAHAVLGMEHWIRTRHHDIVWSTLAQLIGCDARVTVPQFHPYRWFVYCPCGAVRQGRYIRRQIKKQRCQCCNSKLYHSPY